MSEPPDSQRDELALLDATAQAELVRSGQVKPLELVDAAIARVEALNPELNAVVTRQFDRARQQAVAPSLPDGPFRGVPFLLKDLGEHLAGDPDPRQPLWPGGSERFARPQLIWSRRTRALGGLFLRGLRDPDGARCGCARRCRGRSQPAISLPLHWNDDGLPIGIQLVAAYGREDLLIRVAAQLEQAEPWKQRRPALHA